MCDELTYQATLEVLKDTRVRLDRAEAVCKAYGAYETSRAGDRRVSDKLRRVLAKAYGVYLVGKEKDDGGAQQGTMANRQ